MSQAGTVAPAVSAVAATVAFPNAAFDLCIGCGIYLRAQRLRHA